ncbi:FAD-binding oxidoreductase [Aerococcus sp. UMB7834]|uniref:NAD(P)/FAD-dependent oxidoreductase n=1 Tax=Aerococcus sp. UMB7834 TaxID=3046342 RepID=UPI00254D9FDE|nr:FAD-binding oxidoreductase [Aerococcus sp. UMB7834]MDK6804779.1 FAD-binding oxidoreductase [Aerococcus sp. UMB7834]
MKIAVIGGGIVGSTAAFYLSQNPDIDLSLYDYGVGQASKAAAGIICPWFSQRRNKAWYRLANAGAHFYPEMLQDLKAAGQPSQAYQGKETWLLKKKTSTREDVYQIALSRRPEAPLIGDIEILTPAQQSDQLDEWTYDQDLVAIRQGAAIVDGQGLCEDLQAAATKNGMTSYQAKAQIDFQDDQILVITEDGQSQAFDQVILATGAWLGDLLQPHGYQVDVRPQKGMLTVYDRDVSNWPLIMPEGEADIIPHGQDTLYLGATHENDKGFDLEPDMTSMANIFDTIRTIIPAIDPEDYRDVKVGTRAYTSDYAPFYGPVPGHSNLYAASGLGSSGLTTGPIIGYQLAQACQDKPQRLNPEDYDPSPYLEKRV